MADSFPTDHSAPDRQDRTARIEELLLAGLDHYFNGEHDRAIDVWTRVLFLDRRHARARAYIERARGALAERQRESEELIQRGMAAFDQGDTGVARELLSSAVARGGPHDVALALLDRLNRLETPVSTADATARARAMMAAGRRPHAGRLGAAAPRSWVVLAVALFALGIVALYVAISFSDLAGRSPATNPATSAARPAEQSLPVPRSADLALWRAAALKNTGHLKEALVALDRIGTGDAAYADAERLRGEIQGLLVAGLPAPGTPGRADGR
jgi:tetratricopeptide (TPR) repeat protein